MKKNHNLNLTYFSTNTKKKETIDSIKFIQVIKKERKNSFFKEYLLGNMTFNVIYFCIGKRELGNNANYLPLLLKINSYLIKTVFKSFFLKFSLKKFSKLLKFTNIVEKKKFFLKIDFLLRSAFIKLYNSILSAVIKIPPRSEQKKKIKKNNKLPIKNLEIKKSNPVKAFLFLWGTWNNFFVTVVDNLGNTLVSRTGGNTEWTGTRQWSTVYSADQTIYEACFLAKQWGVESLSVHVLSTFWLPQIKNSFEGLETAGLLIDDVVYWPIQVIGGCRLKKPWRV